MTSQEATRSCQKANNWAYPCENEVGNCPEHDEKASDETASNVETFDVADVLNMIAGVRAYAEGSDVIAARCEARGDLNGAEFWERDGIKLRALADRLSRCKRLCEAPF